MQNSAGVEIDNARNLNPDFKKMNTKSTKNSSLVVLPYDQTWPKLAAEPVYAGDRAAVLGQVTLAEGAWLGNQSVLRADGHYIRVGRNFHLGPRGTVHIVDDIYPAIIGHDVSAGENAVIHACEIGDECIIGHGATVLDGSALASGTVLAPASVVYPRSGLEGGWLYSGCPAKPVRPLAPGELESEHARIRTALSAANQPGSKRQQTGAGTSVAGEPFIGCTADISGMICAEPDVSIWYGCHFDAGYNKIMIGTRTNIQDNTTVVCSERDVVIGEDVTIGHNVSLTDCTIGANSLIGISASVARDTVVESDVLLAAGAQTEPGQLLESGWLWAGQPARRITPLNQAKRTMMAQIIPIYCLYTRHFKQSQKAFGKSGTVP